MKATLNISIATLLVLAGFAALGIQAEELEKTPAQLIEQLRSDDFDLRQAAALKLEKQGETARAALEAAGKDDDAEVRTLVSKLIAKLSKATLRIHVFDSEHKPLRNSEGTIVVGDAASPDEDWKQRETPLNLDADGKAELKIQSLGLVRFQLKFPGFLAEESSWSAVEAHSGLNPVVITLDKGGSLKGTVANAAGKPVKDANITLFSGVHFEADTLEIQLLFHTQALNGPPFNNNLLADGTQRVAQPIEDGTWHLENVPEGVYTCVAQAPGHFPSLGAMIRVREGMPVEVPGIILKERNAGKIVLSLKKVDGTAKSKETVSVFITPLYTGAIKERMPAAARSVPIHSDQKDTDENGEVEIGDLSPGKYQVVVTAETDDKGENGGTLIQTEIEVKPGETARPEQLESSKKESAKKGSIKGRIMTANAKGAKGFQVRVSTEENWASLLVAPQNQPNQIPSNLVTEVATDGKGFYRIENLAAGKYAVEFHPEWEEGTGGPRGFVFGIDVALGHETVAPEVTLKGDNVEAPVEIKGRVLLPGGELAMNAELRHVSNRQNNATSTGDNGTFSCMVQRVKGGAAGDAAAKEYLFIRHAGCKPFVAEGPFDADKDYKLQSQDYGSLRITVVDEKGKPLAGVKVSPAEETTNPFSPQQPPHSAITNVKGVARLNGLATGSRELTTAFKGYFLPSRAGRVDVVANEEKEIKLELRPGVRIEGRVRLPDGFSPLVAMATLDDWHFESVGANGEFSFSGVTPGEHYLSAKVPGLVASAAVIFTLPHDTEKMNAAIPKNAFVELVQPGGIAIDCGKEFAGCAAQLVPVASLDATRPPPVFLNQASGAVDATGRAEFRNIAPGQYQLSLTENDLGTDSPQIGELAASPTTGPFEVKPVASIADLAKLETVKADLKRGTGTVSGRIRMAAHSLASDAEKNVTLNLKVQGASAVAEGSLGESIDVYSQPAEALLIVGKPPENFKPHRPGTFEISSLRAGDYKIFASLNLSEADDEDTPHKDEKPKLIGSFIIKDGEKLNLGELKFEPADARAPGKNDFLKEYLRPEDRAQDFEP